MCGTYRLEATDRYIIMYHAEETGLVRKATSVVKAVSWDEKSIPLLWCLLYLSLKEAYLKKPAWFFIVKTIRLQIYFKAFLFYESKLIFFFKMKG